MTLADANDQTVRLFAEAEVPRKAPRPTYDAARDGNVYAWILKAARTVRIQDQAADERARITRRAAIYAARPVLHCGKPE